MFLDNNSFNLPSLNVTFGVKAFFILFLIANGFFALMMLRQIQLMTRMLPTSFSPILKFLAIVYMGFSWAALFVVIGTF